MSVWYMGCVNHVLAHHEVSYRPWTGEIQTTKRNLQQLDRMNWLKFTALQNLSLAFRAAINIHIWQDGMTTGCAPGCRCCSAFLLLCVCAANVETTDHGMIWTVSRR